MEINYGSVIKQIREERGFTLKEAAVLLLVPTTSVNLKKASQPSRLTPTSKS